MAQIKRHATLGVLADSLKPSKETKSIAASLSYPDRERAILIAETIRNVEYLWQRGITFYIGQAEVSEDEKRLFKVLVGRLMYQQFQTLTYALIEAQPDVLLTGQQEADYQRMLDDDDSH